MKREAISPTDRTLLFATYKISPAIRSGDLLFVSGQVGSRPDSTPEPDLEAQVRLAYDHLEATLAAAGCTFDDVIDVTSFHTDPMTQMATASAVKTEKFLQLPYPSWTAVGVNWLSGYDFEIKVIARVPSVA
ncbi:RidA family protein [Novosphingobium sp.]|uniref:RidA family protein n=1 Tax=Novosphingobium sp. TaxID=1874826 RepID=UPI003D0C36F0